MQIVINVIGGLVLMAVCILGVCVGLIVLIALGVYHGLSHFEETKQKKDNKK